MSKIREPVVLILDDDPGVLRGVTQFLEGQGYRVYPCATVDQARSCLSQGVDFAIVDLFLQGDYGERLSNTFIEQELVPAGIPYGRMTSAPDLVPEAFRGLWVLHKRKFFSRPETLLPLLQNLLEEKP